MNQLDAKGVADVTAISGSGKHEDCTKAIVHQIEEAETSVFRVRPGGRIAAHSHSSVWDLFIGVKGTVDISYGNGGLDRQMTLAPQGFLAVPPDMMHEVYNPHREQDALFILIHAPFRGYDHLPAGGARKTQAS